MRKIGEESRNTYVIGYYPSNPIEQKGVRKIKGKINKESNVVLNHHASYDTGK